MPTNKQRREAARRHLERQLERRQIEAQRRKQRNLIFTVVGTVVILAAIVIVVVIAASGTSKKKTASGSSPSASASATDSSADSPKTSGPCGYTQDTSQPAAKDVGFPPDPSPTPTTNRTLSIKSSQGDFTITLNATTAPCTAQSIAYLAGKGYYNNTKCHRLVDSGIYVLQCGDPTGTGSGGPGYYTKDENLDKADYSQVGTVAMANAGAGTDGSQFFIIYKDTSSLPKQYTQIGQVTAGMDVIQKVAAAGVSTVSPNSSPSDTSSPTDGTPNLPITLNTVTVAPPVEGSGTMVTPTPTSASTAASPASSAPSATAPVSSASSG
ncbi:MAG: peptidylprolyl isomerase [Actinobacteria bacterium]|nr:peptidylprolyl isomerase [Actinomycetota bacterium]